MLEQFKKILAAGVVVAAGSVSGDVEAGINKQDIEPVVASQIAKENGMEVFNRVSELEPYLNEKFKHELKRNDFESIAIFPATGENSETIVEISFMGHSDTVKALDPKTGEVIGPGLEDKKTITLEVNKKIAQNKYALQEFLINIINQELGE